MTSTRPFRSHLSSRVGLLALSVTLLAASAPSWALYKVVGPNGEITYTDRPPADAKKAQPLKGASSGTVEASNLPYSLQQAASRYPVTFYTSARCTPCDQGRQFLTRRGIPFVEKTVNTSADIRAYKGLTGTEELPTLKIGNQQITGFGEGEWSSYLNAAGYPQESMLPGNYRAPEATALVPLGSSGSSGPSGPPGDSRTTAPTASPSSSAKPPAGNAPPGFRF